MQIFNILQKQLIKLFDNPLGRWYLKVPKNKKIYKITKSSVHYYTGELSKKNGMPIICTGNCNPNGKFVFNRVMKLAKVVSIFVLFPFSTKLFGPLIVLYDTGYKAPTATGDPNNGWGTPTNGYTDDGNYASVLGGTPVGPYLYLSWNGGTNYTSHKDTAWTSTPGGVYNNGGATDIWGRSWSYDEFSNVNFRVKIGVAGGSQDYYNFDFGLTNNNAINGIEVETEGYQLDGSPFMTYLDYIKVKIYYTEITNKTIQVKASIQKIENIKSIQTKANILLTFPTGLGGKAQIETCFYPANQIIIDSNYTTAMKISDKKIAFRFTAQNTKTATHVKFYITGLTGTSPTYRWGIQADDGNGNPSGSYLGYKDYAIPTAPSLISIPLDSSVNLTKGTIYHIVVQYQSGTINDSNYIDIGYKGPLNQIRAYDNKIDIYQRILRDEGVGGGWVEWNRIPVFIIEYSDGTIEGMPYYVFSIASVRTVYQIAEIINLSENHIIVDTIGVRAWKNATTNPSDHLRYEIWDKDNNVLREGILVTKTEITENEQWHDIQLTTPLIIEGGKNYKLIIKSPLSDNTYYYNIRRCEATNNAGWYEAGYYGIKCKYSYSSNNGIDWTDINYRDLVFRMKNISRGNYYPHNEVSPHKGWYITMDNVNEKMAYRFTAQSSKICSVINFYINLITGTPPAYRVGIQTSDSNNLPSGIWLGYGDVYDINSIGWQSVPMDTEINLVVGTVYHVVIEYLSELIDVNNNFSLLFLGSAFSYVPYNIALDNYLAVERSVAVLPYWYVSGNNIYYPLFVLDFNDLTFYGIPYSAKGTTFIYGNIYKGEYLLMPDTENVIVDGIGFYVKKNSSAVPADDLNYELRSFDDTLLRSGTLTNRGEITQTLKWHDVNFNKLILEANEVYKLILKSDNAVYNNHYEIQFSGTIRNIKYIDLTYQGNESYRRYSNDGGSTWISNHGYDIAFRFSRSAEMIKTIISKGSISILNIIFTIQTKASIIIPATEKTIQTKTNLISIINRTINSLSNIKSIVNRTISSKANIGEKLRFIKTKANIIKLISKTVEVKCRLVVLGLKTITVKTSIYKIITCTIQAKCNINKRKYIKARANIYGEYVAITIIARARIIKDFSSLVNAISRFPRGKIQISWDKSKNLTADGYQYLNESDYLISLESYEELEGAVGESVSADADIVLANNTERFMPKEFKNKLANPSFELNSTPTYWTENNTGGGINIGTVRTRIRSYKINDANGYVVSNNIYIASGLGEEQIQQNENWVFSIYMQGTGTAALKLYAFNTNNEGQDLTTGLLDSNEQATINLTGSWNRSQVSLLVPSGTASLRARFMLEAGGSALYADDAMVERGSTASEFQDIDSKINHLLLPNRPTLLDVGFLTGGITSSGVDYRRVFCGVIDSLTPNINEETINIHCIDWSAKLAEMKSPSLMYTNKKTDQLLEYLAWAAGLGITEYIFETGTLTIPFAWFNEDESIWYWMKKIAEAEGGRIFFDREGILRFWNRNHYANNQSVQYTYTFNSNISNLNFEVSSEKIINHIIVKAKPREEQPNQIIWALQGYETIPANSSLDYEIAVDDPCTVINQPTANADYLANTQSDGSGDDRTSYITINNFTAKAQKATMTINNTHPSEAIYITLFHVKGKPATIMHEIEVDVKDTESINKYKDKILEIENDYIQNIDEAEALAKRRIIELRNPLDFIEIEVIGNPEIKVGDVVRIQDSYDGTTKDLFVVSSRISFTDEIVQTLRLESKILNY